MSGYDEAWASPSAKRWVQHVLEDMKPKMADSVLIASLVPEGDGDVKYWVELGASIMMDKPIVAVVFGDRPLPGKLEQIADEVVRCPEGVDPAASDELAAAIKRVLARLEDDG